MHDALTFLYISLGVVILFYILTHDGPPGILKTAWMKETDRLAYEQAIINSQEEREYMRRWHAETAALREARKEQLRRPSDSPLLPDHTVAFPLTAAQSLQSPVMTPMQLPDAIADVDAQYISTILSEKEEEEEHRDEGVFTLQPPQLAFMANVCRTNRVCTPQMQVTGYSVQNNACFQNSYDELVLPDQFGVLLGQFHRVPPHRSLSSPIHSSESTSQCTSRTIRLPRYEPKTEKVFVNLPPPQSGKRKRIKRLFRRRQSNLSEMSTSAFHVFILRSLRRIDSETETVGKKPSAKEKWGDLRHMLKKEGLGRK